MYVDLLSCVINPRGLVTQDLAPEPLPCLWSQTVSEHCPSLEQLAELDDAGLRKAGLITVRSQQAVMDELRRLGLRQ